MYKIRYLQFSVGEVYSSLMSTGKPFHALGAATCLKTWKKKIFQSTLMRPVSNAEQPDLGVGDQSNVNGQAFPRSWCSDRKCPLPAEWKRHFQIVPGRVGYGSNQLGQIQWCMTIDCMVYQTAEFELDSLCNWQPVKFIHSRFHMILWSQIMNRPTSSAMDSLERCERCQPLNELA